MSAYLIADVIKRVTFYRRSYRISIVLVFIAFVMLVIESGVIVYFSLNRAEPQVFISTADDRIVLLCGHVNNKFGKTAGAGDCK